MDVHAASGASTADVFLTTNQSSQSCIGDGLSHRPNRPPCPVVVTTPKRSFFSRSLGEINSTDTNPERNGSNTLKSESPFSRAFSKSFRQSFRINKSILVKKQSLTETKKYQITDSVTKGPFFSPCGGVFWRASKRILKLNHSSAEERSMPPPKSISRDDTQIRVSDQQQQRVTRQRQRTASPPFKAGRDEKTREKQTEPHLSPFRSLPNAKKKLRALMKWPSGVTASPSSIVIPSTVDNKSSNEGQARTDKNSNWRDINWEQLQGNDGGTRARRSDTNNRIHQCIKDLNVSLRFLDDVVKKDKLLMLDGSASIVLDTVLKLLLILDEKRKRQMKQGNEDPSMLEGYKLVYQRLATLLKFADELTVKNKTVTSVETQKAAELCQALKNSIQALLAAEEARSEEGKMSDPEDKRGGKKEGKFQRKISMISTSSTSSSAADWAAEDEGEARLEQLENSMNGHIDSPPIPEEQRHSLSSYSASRPLSSISTSSSSGCGVSATSKMSLPCALHKQHIQNALSQCTSPAAFSNGSRSPPGSDSGIFSMNDTNGSITLKNVDANSSNVSLPSVQNSSGVSATTVCEDADAGMTFLDEILAKLHLSGVSATAVQECDQQTANGDLETVTEEVEEMVGDTKIIRKKIITRQKVRHQSVVTTTVTTQHPASQPADSMLMQLLSEDTVFMDADPKSPHAKDGLELRTVEKECYKLSGAKHALAIDGEPVTAGNQVKTGDNSISCEVLSPSVPRGHEADPLQSGSKVLISKQRQQSLAQQSASLQSFSRQTLFNGRLIKTETMDRFDTAAMKASKSETFDGANELIERKGDGAYSECSYVTGDRKILPPPACCIHQSGCNCSESKGLVSRSKGLPPQPPPRPPKRSVVSSYVQIFGSGTPSNQADFRSSTLATYVHLRDRWNDHYEAHKRKAMTFQFVSTPNSNPTSSSTAMSSLVKPVDSTSSASSSNSSPKITVSRRKEIEEDGDDGMPVWVPRMPQDEYQNLVNIMNINEHLKLPKQPAVEAPEERKPLPFRTNLALLDVNLLNEIDVRHHLICKRSASEDGPEIRGGPVDALIVHATKTTSDAGSRNSSPSHGHGFCYQEAFITTYRTFISPLELIKKLIYRYNLFNGCIEDSSKQKVAKNTFSLLVRVVDDLSTVEVEEDIMRLLGDLIYAMINNGELNLSRLLRQKLMERYKIKRQRAPDDTQPLGAPDAASVSSKSSTWLDIKSSILAEQFTYLDWYYFQKIELSEMLLWAQEQCEEQSPNLTSFTEHFNKMSYWVRTRILEQSDQKERERVFGKFVKIMRHLRRLNNFNSCLALLSALDSGPIRRLDWPKASVEALNEHSSLIDSSQSFKTYRMAVAEAKPPCLPYIGLILQDLTFVHIGNPNNLPSEQCQGRRDVLNFAKRWQQYTILDNMRRFKAWPYGIKKNDLVLSSLNDFNGYISEDAMWDISERLKPRQHHHNTAGVARRVVVNL